MTEYRLWWKMKKKPLFMFWVVAQISILNKRQKFSNFCGEALTALLLLKDHLKSWNSGENSVISSKPLKQYATLPLIFPSCLTYSHFQFFLLCWFLFSPAIGIILAHIFVYFLLHIPQVLTSDDVSFFSFSSTTPTLLSYQGLYMHFVFTFWIMCYVRFLK